MSDTLLDHPVGADQADPNQVGPKRIDASKIERRHSFYAAIGAKARGKTGDLLHANATGKAAEAPAALQTRSAQLSLPAQPSSSAQPSSPAQPPSAVPVDAAARTGYERRLLEHDQVSKSLARYSPATDAKLKQFGTVRTDAIEVLKVEPTDYAGALAKLAVLDLDQTQDWIKKEGPGWSKKTRDTAKDRAAYEERLVRHRVMETELQDYKPASDGSLNEFAEARQAAEQILATDPFAFKVANKALHRVHVSNALEKAEESWNALSKNVRKNPAVDKVYQDIERIRAILADRNKGLYFSLDARGKIETFRGESERTLLADANNPNKLATLRDSVSQRVTAVQQQLQAAKEDYDEYVRKRVMLDKSINDLAGAAPQPLATVEELAVPQRLLRDALAMASTIRDYREAASLANLGLDTCNRLATDNAALQTHWVQGAKELDQLITDLKVFRSTAQAPGITKAALDMQETLEVEKDKGLVVGVDVSLKSMADKLVAAKAVYAALVVEEIAWQAFKDQGKAANGRVMTRKDAAKNALGDLWAVIKETNPRSDVAMALEPFTVRITAASDAWAKRLGEATTIDKLDEAGATAAYDSIVTAANELAVDPNKVAGQVSLCELERKQVEYDEARAAAELQVNALAAFDALAAAPVLKKLRAENDALSGKRTPGGYDVAIGKVARLGEDAKAQLVSQQKKLDEESLAFHTLAALIDKQLTDLLEAASQMSNVSKRTFHLQLHGELSASYDQLRALAGTHQLSLVQQAVLDGAPVLDDAKTALAEAKGNTLEDGGKPVYSFKEANNDLAKVKKLYGDSEVQTYMLESATKLKEKTEKLEKAMGQRTLSQLCTDVTALMKESQELRGRAKGGRDEANKLDEELDRLASRLGGGGFKDATGLVEQIKAEIKRIKGIAHYEGGVTQAWSFYKALRERLDRLESPALRVGDKTPAERFADAEEGAQEALRQGEADSARFEANCETLLKQIATLETGGVLDAIKDKARGALNLDRTSSEKGGLREMIKQARKTAKTDIETAKDQLQVIRSRISLLDANPNGLLMHARKQVPAAERRWAASVQAYVNALGEVRAAIDALPPGDFAPVGPDAVTARITEVTLLFRPGVFSAAVKAFQNALDDKERAGAREQALGEVRRLRTTLLNDFRLQTLATCPFVRMNGLLSELNLSLLDLENNLLISM